MTPHGATMGHLARKLRQLRDAGERGLPEEKWGQSQLVVPAMLEQKLARFEERQETVRYLVVTKAGLAKLAEIDGG